MKRSIVVVLLSVVGYALFLGIVVVVSLLLFSGFANAATVSFAGHLMEANGTANVVGGVLRLTTDGGGQTGSAFINTPFAFNGNSSFSTFFQFRIYGAQGSGGADGLAFVIQNDPAGMDALGGGGGGLGYGGITKSLAVEFDTWQNGGDPNNNHIGVDTNGNLLSLATYSTPPDLNSGSSLYAWVDYNGATNMLDVYINTTSTKPGTPVISQVVDISPLVGGQVYVGFTAATGAAWNIHDIEAWQFAIATPAPTCTHTMNLPTSPANIGTFTPGIYMSYDPMVARPFGLEEAGGILSGRLWLPCWRNGHVDIYLVVSQSPYGQLVMNEFHQWLPYPANVVPWKAYTADAVYAQLFSYLKSTVAAGSYQLDVIVVPSGTPAATVQQVVAGTSTAPYYRWSFTKTL
ncbi:MAG: hypothetical protein HZA23_08405 [Nitrospirae bacterium]|nr:hypothetical protein [Nitrospirota bacterium]